MVRLCTTISRRLYVEKHTWSIEAQEVKAWPTTYELRALLQSIHCTAACVELILHEFVLTFISLQLIISQHRMKQRCSSTAGDVLNDWWFSSLLFLPRQLPVIHVACQPTNAHTNSTLDSKAAGEIYL